MHIDVKREVTGSASGRFGMAALGVIVILAVFAPFIAGYDPTAQTPFALEPPSRAHLLGTNHVGQDVWSQLVYGARVSLLVGFSVACLSTLLSALLGSSAALIGGLYDKVVMRVVDAFITVPAIFIMILVAAYLGSSLWVLVILLSLLGWQAGARIVRAQALSLKEENHVLAARCFGAGNRYLILRHILPDLGPILLVEFIFSMRRAIFMQAGLAFIGIGDPGTVSWGMMMNEAREFIFLNAWLWWLLPAGLILSLTIVAITFIGHSLEPAMDPRLGGEVVA